MGLCGGVGGGGGRRVVKEGRVLRGEGELGCGRASVSGGCLQNSSGGECGFGEAAWLVYPPLKQVDLGNHQDFELSP